MSTPFSGKNEKKVEKSSFSAKTALQAVIFYQIHGKKSPSEVASLRGSRAIRDIIRQ